MRSPFFIFFDVFKGSKIREKEHRLRQPGTVSNPYGLQVWAGEAFWVGLGMVLSILALLAGTRYLTHLLSTEQYGLLALAVSLAALAVQVFGEPIGKTAVRFYSLWRRSGMPPGFMKRLAVSLVTATAWIFFIGIAGVVACLLAPGCPRIGHVVLTGMFAVVLVFNRVALALEDAARRRRFRGMMQAGFEAGRFVAAGCLIALLAAPDAAAVLAGFVLAGGLAAGIHFLYLKKLLAPDGQPMTPVPDMPEKTMDTRAMRAFHLPLIVSNGGIWLVMMADRWWLSCFGDPGDVGGYSAVYQLGFIPMLVIGNFLILLLEPVLYQMAGTDKQNATSLQGIRINQYAALGIVICSAVAGTVFFFGHPFVGGYLLGADFRIYSWLFPWLILAGGSFAASQQLLLKLSCDMRTDLLAKLWGGMAVVAVGAYAAGAAWWGLGGVVTAVVAVNMGVLVTALVLVSKKQGVAL